VTICHLALLLLITLLAPVGAYALDWLLVGAVLWVATWLGR
jgi:hypothetical protein